MPATIDHSSSPNPRKSTPRGTRSSRNTRLCTTKVKSGCKTCKARRIKCDERRPACSRCTRSGRECQGYGIWGGGTVAGRLQQPGHQQQQGLARKRPGISGGFDGERPPWTLALFTLQADEKPYYERFLHQISPKMAGVSYSPFWGSILVQAVCGEKALRHAVLALSASFTSAAKDWSKQIGNGDKCVKSGSLHNGSDHAFILHHYNKAIQGLGPHLDPRPGQLGASRRVVLAVCLVFVCVEYVQGRFATGVRHLESGLRLISQRSPNHAQDTPEDVSFFKTFQRLRGQVDLFRDDRVFVGQPLYPLQLGHQDLIPPLFRSSPEARSHLDTIADAARALPRYEPSNLAVLKKAAECKETTLRALQRWLDAHETMPSLAPEHVWNRLLYHMNLANYYMISIIANTSLARDEMIFDTYEDSFVEILHQYRLALDAILSPLIIDSRFQHNHEIPPFSIEDGVAVAIFFVVVKCRHGALRQRALSLLDASNIRQGLYDMRMLSKVGHRVLELEAYSDTQTVPPLESRLRNLTIHWFDQPASYLTISYQQWNTKWQTIHEKLAI